ncbi:MAG: P1 family peptidase [Candidatus Krumholzibacteria bacterium]|nr:P1 family peptidase [Candidatus Krumholzibacteria bacterium]
MCPQSSSEGEDSLKWSFDSFRPRAREIGIDIGLLPTGGLNSITDVEGVKVGHRTIDKGDDVRTGVTVIIPHGSNLFSDKVPGAIFVGNGFGKAAGISQVREMGTIETPIVLTSTLNVPEAVAALMEYTLGFPGNEDVRSVNPVVGETNDGYLSNIRIRPVMKKDVLEAIRTASTGPVTEGSVGAGRGTVCLGFKGGIGTSSRRAPTNSGIFTVGVLVQSNFGGILQINGAPVGRELGHYYLSSLAENGSCIIVIATDAPLGAASLERLAKRAVYSMARTGSVFSNGSGDYAIAFSTNKGMRVCTDSSDALKTFKELPSGALTPLFLAVQEATEEAIINSILRAESVCGWRGHCVEAVPVDRVVDICSRYGVLGYSGTFPSVKLESEK